MTDTIRRVQCADLISCERIPPIELFNMSIISNICVCVRVCAHVQGDKAKASLSLSPSLLPLCPWKVPGTGCCLNFHFQSSGKGRI